MIFKKKIIISKNRIKEILYRQFFFIFYSMGRARCRGTLYNYCVTHGSGHAVRTSSSSAGNGERCRRRGWWSLEGGAAHWRRRWSCRRGGEGVTSNQVNSVTVGHGQARDRSSTIIRGAGLRERGAPWPYVIIIYVYDGVRVSVGCAPRRRRVVHTPAVPQLHGSFSIFRHRNTAPYT